MNNLDYFRMKYLEEQKFIKEKRVEQYKLYKEILKELKIRVVKEEDKVLHMSDYNHLRKGVLGSFFSNPFGF